MSVFADKCPQCGREYRNYSDVRAWRRFCSVGCEVRSWQDEPDQEPAALKRGKK
jgi:hypothetical protein